MKKMKKIFVSVVLLLIAVSAGEASWLARDWLMKGNGWAEKGIVRVHAKDVGSLVFTISEDVSGDQYVTNVRIEAELTMSGLDIEAWSFAETTEVVPAIPVPEIEPTLDNPITINGIPFKNETVDIQSYSLSITSASSGAIKVRGEILEHGIDFSLDNVIWQGGTPEPETPDNKSGCNMGAAFPFLLIPLLLKRARRV